MKKWGKFYKISHHIFKLNTIYSQTWERLMLDVDWMKEALKEAIEDENWDLVREVIAYLSDDDIFEQYKEDEDWWKGADDD